MPTMPPQQTCKPAVAYVVERLQAIVVRARRHDLAVEIGRGVEVVVVVVEARPLQALGLTRFKHAQRRAGLEAKRLDLAHHRQHRFEIALLRSAPRSTHAKPGRPGSLGRRGRGDNLVHAEHRFVVDASVIARRLRTITAILGTAAGLDRKQGGQLDGIGIVVRRDEFPARDEASRPSAAPTAPRPPRPSTSLRNLRAYEVEQAQSSARPVCRSIFARYNNGGPSFVELTFIVKFFIHCI